MTRGLQVMMRGDEVCRRIEERIRAHEESLAALDGRLEARRGDLPFDVRLEEDGLKSLADLLAERDSFANRVTTLTMLRDSIVRDDSYVLSKADMYLAELIVPDAAAAPEIVSGVRLDGRAHVAIEGLRLTFTGDELRLLLQERIDGHHARADSWDRERVHAEKPKTEETDKTDDPDDSEQQTETDESQPVRGNGNADDEEDDHDEAVVLPVHICENEAERHRWHAEVLSMIRAHVEAGQIYRLSEADLVFGELLPEKPGWMKQDEYEQRREIGMELARIRQELRWLPSGPAKWVRELDEGA